MSFLVSPGVSIKEIDATNVIPAVSTAIGGYVGTFDWGPAEEAILVSSEKELASIFSAPSPTNAKSFLIAASFLKYASALKVSRAVASDALNAASGTAVLIKNKAGFDNTPPAVSVVARYAGPIGNKIKIQIADYVGWTKSTNDSFKSQFDYAPTFTYNPGTIVQTVASQAARFALTVTGAVKLGVLVIQTDTNAIYKLTDEALIGAAGGWTLLYTDEIHVLITDATTGTILEKYTGLSLAPDGKKADGSSIYYKNVINQSSSYVYLGSTAIAALAATTAGDDLIYNATTSLLNAATASSANTLYDVTLTGGTNSTGGSTAVGYADAADVFADADIIDVSLLFGSQTGTATTTAGVNGTPSVLEDKFVEIAQRRMDCVVFVSAPEDIATQTSSSNKMRLAINKAGAFNTSYAVVDSTPVYVYNKYQDNYVWIPGCGHIAGLCARTDSTNDTWWSPAGYNRGVILGVTKLAFNPNQSERDELYKVGCNPIVSFPGSGIMLYGDKTSQKKPSAFDRINVRRLFIVLEKAIATAAKFQLFEFNDQFTRSMFINMVEPFLRDVKGRRGVYDFKVVCDETNNTPEVIDTNRFVGDIYIKPARSINFINLNFIAVRTGVAFSEIAGGN